LRGLSKITRENLNEVATIIHDDGQWFGQAKRRVEEVSHERRLKEKTKTYLLEFIAPDPEAAFRKKDRLDGEETSLRTGEKETFGGKDC